MIDDPIKTEDAESENNREAFWDWYTSTAYTRLAPGGGILVILTRWHDDDLAGRLLMASEDGADDWEVVKITQHSLKRTKSLEKKAIRYTRNVTR